MDNAYLNNKKIKKRRERGMEKKEVKESDMSSEGEMNESINMKRKKKREMTIRPQYCIHKKK